MTPEEIESQMTGRIATGDDAGIASALLPSPVVQNHAAFLDVLTDGRRVCAWFGGRLEGASDVSIYGSVLAPGAGAWGPAHKLTDDPERSEQNPVIIAAQDGTLKLFNTAQPAGNQDECLLRIRDLRIEGDAARPGPSRDLDLPLGTFVRSRIIGRDDGAWMLPVFRCNGQPGQRWTGSHDTAGVAVSTDQGATWSLADVPDSVGAVHMTIVPLDEGQMVAFYRRRQADFVHRSTSADGGRTWSAPEATDVPNNNSSINAIRLADGRIAMVCNPTSRASSEDRRASLYDELEGTDDRPDAAGGCEPVWGVPRAPVTLCLSSDGGRTFSERRIIEDGPGTCLSNNSVDGRNQELSYPYLAQTADGALHLAYTYHRRAIKYVRLTPGWIDTND